MPPRGCGNAGLGSTLRLISPAELKATFITRTMAAPRHAPGVRIAWDTPLRRYSAERSRSTLNLMSSSKLDASFEPTQWLRIIGRNAADFFETFHQRERRVPSSL